MVQPRRLGQGPRRVAHDRRCGAQWATDARPHPHRRHQRQHRHRLCDDRRGQGLRSPSGHAGQRHTRAKALAWAYGARIIESDPLEGTDGAIRLVRQIVAVEPQRYFYPDQYNNEGNWRAHFDTTGPVIPDRPAAVMHFVAGLGTTGTFTGIGRRLKQHNPAIELVALQPADELQVIEGLKHLPTSLAPGIYDADLPDRQLSVEAEAAWLMTRRLARQHGLFVGFSSGAAVWGALHVARGLEHGVVVTVLPDGGARDVSLGLFEEGEE